MKRWPLRLLAASVMFMCLAGPAPGNVGGCGSERNLADAREHCINSKYWECYRDLYAGRTMMADYDACLAQINPMCSGRIWPAGCEPSQTQSDACIILLSRADRAATPTPELIATYPDCNLCP